MFISLVDELTIIVKGNATLHVTGFYEPDQDADLPFDEEDLEDLEDEESEEEEEVKSKETKEAAKPVAQQQKAPEAAKPKTQEAPKAKEQPKAQQQAKPVPTPAAE